MHLRRHDRFSIAFRHAGFPQWILITPVIAIDGYAGNFVDTPINTQAGVI